MEKVFISYGHSDQLVADKLCAYLENTGIACWIAPRDISSGNYAGEITRALRAADIVVVICSKDSCCSEHVKNEVTLAFNNKKQILPYCLEDNVFDDDLEYFLSSKQRIQATKSADKDFPVIEKMIREYRHLEPAGATTVPKKKPSSRLVIRVLLGLLILGIALYFNWPRDKKQAVPVQEETTTVLMTEEAEVALPEPDAPAQVAEVPATKVIPRTKAMADVNADTFSGTITNGYPDGFGILRFKNRRRIDMHDEEERFANPGDYIEGSWENGHLNYGTWYKADGSDSLFIQLKDHLNKEIDHQLGKCVKP